MMKNLHILILSLIISVASALSVSAQKYSYGMDEALDSAAVQTIRARMDSIRRKRPTVALVLSGGGAKGAAHTGTFRMLEEMKIPVDIVLGTSMGGLMGGMYAVGYTPDQIDSIMHILDWSKELSDKVPMSYISYQERLYKRKYALSMPFFYARNDFEKQKAENLEGVIHKMDDIHLGAQTEEDEKNEFRDNLLSSLPSGLVYGQNVSNLFSSMTAGYQDDMPFWKLPVPFVCVATEMVTGKPKIWYSGRLTQALRSTMAIPGLFTPVYTDGMVLLDGGMRDNYPTDIARNLGADYVIGVDLNSGYKSYDELKNLTDILMQGTDMLGRASYENNVPLADVTVKPDMKGYNMLSFDPVSIDSLIARGYKAAQAQEEGFRKIKDAVGEDSLTYQGKHAYNLLADKVLVSVVDIDGVKEEESRYLMNKSGIRAGQRVGSEELDKAVAIMYGTKTLDSVTYELVGSEEPFRLVFHCKRAPIHQLGLGVRADSDEIVAVLLNLGFNVHSLSGHAATFTGKIGSNPYARLGYYYKIARGPAVNFATTFKYVDRNKFSFGKSQFNVSYFNTRIEAYLSNMNLMKMDVNYGVRTDFYRVGSVMAKSAQISDVESFGKNSYLSLFFGAHADTFDDGYFPSKGYNLGVDYSWIICGMKEHIDPFHTAKFHFKTVANMGSVFSLLPFVDARFIFGNDVPHPYVNAIGGRIAGRYFDQQIPFIGVTNASACEKFLVVAGTDLRFRVAKNNFVSAIVNVSDTAPEIEDLAKSDSFDIGAGLEYAYNSIVGPIKADIHWSSISKSVGCYFSIGFDF